MSGPFCILLVEDNSNDVELIKEALISGKITHELHVVNDGVEALAFLRKEPPFDAAPQPDIILLDLNLPRKDGRQVLSEVKADKNLARIPDLIMTASDDEKDILKSYNLHANGYIVKPLDPDQFFKTIRQLGIFWMSIVKLSSRTN